MTKSGPESSLRGATVHGPVIFVIFQSHIEAFDIASRAWLGSSASPLKAWWQGQRFFKLTSSDGVDIWYILSYDGIKIRFDPIPLPKPHASIIRMFERTGDDGPFAISARATVINLSDQTERALFAPPTAGFQVTDVDVDGGRILVQIVARGVTCKNFIVDTQTGPDPRAGNEIHVPLIAYDVAQIPAVVQPIRRLTSVLIRNEQLTICTKGLSAWQFHKKNDRLVLVSVSESRETDRLSKEFEPVKNALDSLRVAEWDDGSRIWIDCYGLLHLKSSDPLIPETTLLLNMDGVVVWTNNGQALGSSYYIDDHNSWITPEEVIDQILIPFVLRLR